MLDLNLGLVLAGVAGSALLAGYGLLAHRNGVRLEAALAARERTERDEASALRAVNQRLQAALASSRQSAEELQARLGQEREAHCQALESLRAQLAASGAAATAAQDGATRLAQGIDELLRVDQAIERWHESMDSLLRHNGDMRRKNADFAQIVRQMTIVTLNASIEAARAGVAGRGFAVVAEEMRGLAQRAETLSKEYRDGLHENDLITTSTFQDLQAGGKMIVSTVVGLRVANEQTLRALRSEEPRA
ncbi:methyl-accepting chemotaxis protein [Azohydromonas australica]|uniref:methyl-accepting chemotaxis protein n=1 Tax=Azohydromonas australica TaxID=364039 RepID=UPI000406CFF5|nr:methyl-accepting chemotaxis protein [Azohydromonas australica]